MDLRDELIQGLLKEYAALGRIREKLAIQLEALGVDVDTRDDAAFQDRVQKLKPQPRTVTN